MRRLPSWRGRGYLSFSCRGHDFCRLIWRSFCVVLLSPPFSCPSLPLLFFPFVSLHSLLPQPAPLPVSFFFCSFSHRPDFFPSFPLGLVPPLVPLFSSSGLLFPFRVCFSCPPPFLRISFPRSSPAFCSLFSSSPLSLSAPSFPPPFALSWSWLLCFRFSKPLVFHRHRKT